MRRWTLKMMTALVFLAVTGAVVAAEGPVTVSPGNVSKVAGVENRCPTFSWGGVDGAKSYELVVYRLGDEGEEARPVLQEGFPGSVYSWTPASESCLERGGQYAWAVRSIGPKQPSEWSAPSLFEVAVGPSEAEFEAALDVVKSYLAFGRETADSVSSAREAAAVEGPRRVTTSGASGTSGVPEATQLSVDGNVDAASFTGDGENLAGVATDAELATHSAEADAHFEHASSLVELNVQIGASLADGAHTADTDTTCLDGGVACNFAGSSSEGGAATVAESGDSATGFFSVGQIEEARIADEIARNAEVFPPGGGALRLIQCASANGWRYYDLGDGTVLDCNTGLIWLKDASCAELAGTDGQGQGTWETAQAAVATLASGTCGLTDGSQPGDWRQPTVQEFCSAQSGDTTLVPCPSGAAPDSLIDSSVSGSPKVVNAKGDGQWSAGDAFVEVQSSDYWSATEFVDFINAWSVDLGNGNVVDQSKALDAYIWPVRGGQ